MKGPLSGVRVLDMSSVILGPYISQLLGDWDAEVIKIEPPAGDTTRDIATTKTPGMSALFMNMNRNKRSIVLDLTKPGSDEVLHGLVKNADIVIHNYRPKPAAKLGVSYDILSKVNPRIITCTTVGYGSQGPYKDRPAYDDLIQGVSGMADLIGRYHQADPRYVPTAQADKTGSLMALSSILAALYQREKSGEGQAIEVPMFETLASYILVEHLTGPAFVPPIGPAGYVRQMAPTRRPFRTKDGFLCVMPYTNRHWKSFFEYAGHPELVTDPRFDSVMTRTENISVLYGKLEELLGGKSTAEWLVALEEIDIPFAPVNTVDDLLNDPHLEAVGFFAEYDHPTEGRLRRVTSPAKFSKSVPGFQFGAPHLGEHSLEILKELEFSEDKIQQLLDAGATKTSQK